MTGAGVKIGANKMIEEELTEDKLDETCPVTRGIK